MKLYQKIIAGGLIVGGVLGLFGKAYDKEIKPRKGIEKIANAEYQNNLPSKFFLYIRDYAKKQGIPVNDDIPLNPIFTDFKDPEKFKWLSIEDYKPGGFYDYETGNVYIRKDLSLENKAAVTVHEFYGHKQILEGENEVGFNPIEYKLIEKDSSEPYNLGEKEEQKNDWYIAILEPNESKESAQGFFMELPSCLILNDTNEDQSPDDYVIYNRNGDKITDLKGELKAKVFIVSSYPNRGDYYKVRGDEPYYERGGLVSLAGLRGEFCFVKKDKSLVYRPSIHQILIPDTEVIARLWEEIFGGHYLYNWLIGNNIVRDEFPHIKTTLKKDLLSLSTVLNEEGRDVAKHAYPNYQKLGDIALAQLINKSLEIGGVTFPQAFKDLQDEDLSLSLTLGNIILDKEDFNKLLDLYDKKGKEKVITRMKPYIDDLKLKKKVTLSDDSIEKVIGEEELIHKYLKNFNLLDDEVKEVLEKIEYDTFEDVFNNGNKVQHIEEIKRRNLEEFIESVSKKDDLENLKTF